MWLASHPALIGYGALGVVSLLALVWGVRCWRRRKRRPKSVTVKFPIEKTIQLSFGNSGTAVDLEPGWSIKVKGKSSWLSVDEFLKEQEEPFSFGEKIRLAQVPASVLNADPLSDFKRDLWGSGDSGSGALPISDFVEKWRDRLPGESGSSIGGAVGIAIRGNAIQVGTPLFITAKGTMTSTPPETKSRFRAGQWVRHLKWGLGRVVRSDSVNDYIVESAFGAECPWYSSFVEAALPRKGEWWNKGNCPTCRWKGDCGAAKAICDISENSDTAKAALCGCLIPVNFGKG